jgi:hypothetical protein
MLDPDSMNPDGSTALTDIVNISVQRYVQSLILIYVRLA